MVYSLKFCMNMDFLSSMPFFVDALNFVFNGGFSHFVGESHCPSHISAGGTDVCPDHSMFACFLK